MESFTRVNDTMICHDMNERNEYHNMISCHDVKETISKNDYFYLVETLEKWRVFYPKAQIKKYGAKNCWEAMNRVKSSNARVPGAYFTATVRNMIKNDTPLGEDKSSEYEITSLKRNECINTPKEPKKLNLAHPVSGKYEINNWQEARKFICDVYAGKIEKNDNIMRLIDEVKLKYNFA